MAGTSTLVPKKVHDTGVVTPEVISAFTFVAQSASDLR